MKNQKGFAVPLLVAIIAILIIGGGFYIYINKKIEAPIIPNLEIQQTDDQNSADSSKASSVVIVSPKAGDTFNAGQNIGIKWTSSSKVSYFLLSLNDEIYYRINIPNNLDASGSFQYTIPSDVIIGKYQISAWYSPDGLTLSSESNILGSSGQFNVISSHNCSEDQSWNGSVCIIPIQG